MNANEQRTTSPLTMDLKQSNNRCYDVRSSIEIILITIMQRFILTIARIPDTGICMSEIKESVTSVLFILNR